MATRASSRFISAVVRFVTVLFAAELILNLNHQTAAFAEPDVAPSPPIATSPSPAASAASPDRTIPPPPLSRHEALDLSAQMAEVSYSLHKNMRTLSELVFSYEKLIDFYCMPELQKSLSYQGHSSNPACGDTIEKVLALDSDNPVAICARDGIDAPSCAKAFDGEIVALLTAPSYTFADEPKAKTDDGMGIELDLRIAESRASTAANKLDSDISSANTMYTEHPSPEGEKRLKSLLSSLLFESCSTVKVRLTTPAEKKTLPLEVVSSTIVPNATPSSPDDVFAQDLKKMVKNLDPKKPTAEATPAPQDPLSAIQNYIRLRLITPNCKYAAERAALMMNNFAAPTCYRVGFNSPDCIRAKRKELAVPHPTPQTSGSPLASSPPSQNGKGGSIAEF